MVHIDDVASVHVNAAKRMKQKHYNGNAFFLTSSKAPNTLNSLLGVGVDEKHDGHATQWGLPWPEYWTLEETKSIAAWNEQVYFSTTVPRYTTNLTDSTILMFGSTWWFDSSQAKNELGWNPTDILEMVRKCVAETGSKNVSDELDKKNR